jgi:hypothetical protein
LRVIVEVEGGVVQAINVDTDDPIEVFLVDHDDSVSGPFPVDRIGKPGVDDLLELYKD